LERTDEKNYGHLTELERQDIQEQQAKGYGVRAIARMLGRDPASISRELKRNTVNSAYVAKKASVKSGARRRAAKFQGKKIVANQNLCAFIEKALMQRQSPEGIAGRLKAGLEPGLPYVSRDTIETYIRSEHGRQLEYKLKVLKAGQKKRNKPKRPSLPPRGDPKKSIDDRPGVIKNRERVGDLEVDFIVSGKTGTGYALTAADRKLRVGFIRKILPVTVANALQALQDIKRVFPELTSITTDNDILWQFHKALEEALGVPFYFCDSYSSWQKGSVENYNGVARKYIKKGSDISQYGEVYIQTVEAKLNNRYMEVLGYKTPKEALEEYRGDRDLKL
jgi:IS30 family transposase